MKECNNYLNLAGRVLIGAIFLFAGYGKIMGFAGTKGYMMSSAMGVLGSSLVTVLLLVAILIEVGCGLMLIIGYKTRFAALLLAFFVLVATVIFHTGTGQSMLFTKNLMILGGLLILSSAGAMRFSLDGKCNLDGCNNCNCESKVEKKEKLNLHK